MMASPGQVYVTADGQMFRLIRPAPEIGEGWWTHQRWHGRKWGVGLNGQLFSDPGQFNTHGWGQATLMAESADHVEALS